MEFSDVIQNRHSVRAYTDDPVPEDVLVRILEAARKAPSASNKQPWKLVVVSDQTTREAIAASGTYGKFLSECPIAIIGIGEPTVAPKWHVVDTTIALEHIVLAATAEGLGSCWIGSFDEATVKGLIGVPEGLKAVAIIALGYEKRSIVAPGAAGKIQRPNKRLDELVSKDTFSESWGV
jgi:nitroreductase